VFTSSPRGNFDVKIRDASLWSRFSDRMLSIAPMRVCNESRPPVGINRSRHSPTPTGFAEIVSDDFPLLHASAASFLEDGTVALLVVGQVKSVLFCELLDLRFSILFVQRPDALQFVLINCAMSPFHTVQ